MQHLPSIENPSYSLPQIPCFCRVDDYDGQGLAGILERVGWLIDRQQGSLPISNTESALRFPADLLQAWLFFGMLHEMFRGRESYSAMHCFLPNFVDEKKNGNYITIASLKQHIETLLEREKGQNVDMCLQRQTDLQRCFDVVNTFFGLCMDSQRSCIWKVSSTLSLDFSLLILTIEETLKNAAEQIWSIASGTKSFRLISFTRRQNFLENRLIQYGWCRSEVSMLFRTLDNTGLFVATRLKRPFIKSLQHKNCIDRHCLTLQVNNDEYETTHAADFTGDASCYEFYIEEEKLCSILESEGIPIIYLSLSGDNKGSPRVKVIVFHFNNLDYFAFSHV
jgi:hypothetical protein